MHIFKKQLRAYNIRVYPAQITEHHKAYGSYGRFVMHSIPSSTLCFQKKLEIASCWSTFCTTQSISQTESYPTLIQSAIDQIANFFLHSTEEIKIRGHQKKKIEIRATEKYILSLPRWSLISSCPSYVRFHHCSELSSYLLTWCMHFHKY